MMVLMVSRVFLGQEERQEVPEMPEKWEGLVPKETLVCLENMARKEKRVHLALLGLLE